MSTSATTTDNGADGASLSDRALAFLARPDVARLLEAAGRDYLTDATLAACLEGSELKPDEARTLLSAALRPLGVLGTKVGDFQYWLYVTAEIRRCLHLIDTTCTDGSQLARALAEHPAAGVRLNVITAIASARLDGVEIDFDSAQELLLLTRRPRNNPECVVANSFALYGEVAEYARRAPSVEMYAEIYGRLTEGIAKPNGWLDAPRTSEKNIGPFTFATARAVIEKACSISEEDSKVTGGHPAIVGMRLLSIFLIAEPCPMLNGTMGRLAQHIHAVRSGFPTLGVAPYAEVYADWQRGAIGAAEGIGDAYIPPRSPQGSPMRADITEWATRQMQVVARAIQRVREEVDAAEAEYQTLRCLLVVDPPMNRRQRSILGRSLESTDAEFRIAWHKTANDIAYSTARADLEELVERGLLLREREGHSFVYRPAEGIADRVVARS